MDNLDWAFEPQQIKRTPYKGEIGELESMLDSLIGYNASEVTTEKGYKQQYAERMSLIEQAKLEAPEDIVNQIEKIEDRLNKLREARESLKNIDNGLDNLNKQSESQKIKKDIQFIKITTSKLQQKYKEEFKRRMLDKELIIHSADYSCTLDEFEKNGIPEKEFYEYIYPRNMFEGRKVVQYPSNILEDNIRFETELWWLRECNKRKTKLRGGGFKK